MIVTGLGTGRLPVAPGTWGSAAVCGIFLLVAWGSEGRAACLNGTMAVLAVVSAVACVALGDFAQKTYRRQDPRQCTIDEWAGQAVALLGLPVVRCDTNGQWLMLVGVSFVTFRIFDIVKPPPARQCEKLTAGWGILFDDIAAAVYANVCAQLLLRLVLLK